MRRTVVVVLSVLWCLSTNAAAIKGFGISPEGFPLDYSALPSFYSEVAGMSGGVMWNGSWRDDAVAGTGAGVIPTGAKVNFDSASAYGFTPSAVFGWRSGATVLLKVPANATNNWTNGEARNLFRQMLVEFATRYRPRLLFLGNENDFYYEQNPSDYANWIAFYNETYDAIKAVSPATTVGPVFSYEHMAGSGALNGWTRSHWPALEMHDLARVDVVGITLYPWLNHATASSVPASYLDPLLARIGSKPIAVTETGWPAENLGGLNPPWETGELAQVTYLTKLSAMLRSRQFVAVNHLFLHAMRNPGGSPMAWKLFGSVSLRDAGGNARMAYPAWLSFSAGITPRRRTTRH